MLYDRARGGRRGEFVSVNSQQDRTILCDLLPLKSGGFRGFALRFQLAAVPGQAIYAPARRVVLRGSDGVVFVANSATDRFHENVQAFRELQGHLLAQQLDPHTIPMVLQYNKRDLPELLDFHTLDRGLNPRKVPTFGAVAMRGEGVLETFAEIIRLTLADVSGLPTLYPYKMDSGPFSGQDPRSVLNQAVEWWDPYISAIESEYATTKP